MPKRSVNLEKSFGGALEAKEIPALQQEIEQLKAKLQEKPRGDSLIAVDKIQPNPNQPRRSFYDLDKLARSLQDEGQKEPVFLVQIEEDKYTLFDGERRWRSAKQLGWEKIQAVVLPFNEETFDDDVLISSIQRSSLNALDLSEALVKKICQLANHLEINQVITTLNTAVVRLKRQGKQALLSQLVTMEVQERQGKILELELLEDERLICSVLLDYGLNPASVSQNQFPMLRLPDDLKKAIRNRGLGDGQARAIGKIEAKKLEVSERKAQSLRTEIVEEVLNKKLSVSKTQQLVREEITKYTKDSQPKISLPVQRCLNAVKKLKIAELTENEKQELMAILQERLSQLQY